MNNLSYQTSLTNIVLIHQIEWMVSNIQYFWYQIQTIIIILIGIKRIWIIFKFNNEIDEAEGETFKCDDETGEVGVDDIIWISSSDIVKLQLMFDKDNIKKRNKFRFWLITTIILICVEINQQAIVGFFPLFSYSSIFYSNISSTNYKWPKWIKKS